MTEKMLSAIRWNTLGTIDLLERVKRIYITTDQKYREKMSYFWETLCFKNMVVAALLYRFVSSRYGVDEPGVKLGRSTIGIALADEGIRKDSIVDKTLVHLILGQYTSVIQSLAGYEMGKDSAKKLIQAIDSECFSESEKIRMITCLLQAIDVSQLREKGKLYKLIYARFQFDMGSMEMFDSLKQYVKTLIRKEEFMGLEGVSSIFRGINLVEVAEISEEQFYQMCMKSPNNLGMLIYKNYMLSIDEDKKQILEKLKEFTWHYGGRPIEYLLNDYILFSVSLQFFPNQISVFIEDYDYLYEHRDKELYWGTYLNKEYLEKTFIQLVRANVYGVNQFLVLMGNCNRFAYNEKKVFSKSLTWSNEIRADIYRLYMDYILEMIQDYSENQAVFIYMNSPMKSYVDFVYLINRLKTQSIQSLFANYWFKGKIKSLQTGSFRCSISSVASTYKFPVYYNWGVENNLAEKVTDGDSVMFQLYGQKMQRDGYKLIFVYNIEKAEKEEKQTT